MRPAVCGFLRRFLPILLLDIVEDTGHEVGTPWPRFGRRGSGGAVCLVSNILRHDGACSDRQTGDAEDDQPPEVIGSLAVIEVLGQLVEGQKEIKGQRCAVEQGIGTEIGGEAEEKAGE